MLPEPVLKQGEEWNYVLQMLVYKKKMTMNQYSTAYNKRKSLKNSQHIMQILYELGYVKYGDFAEFMMEIFGNSAELIRGHSSQLIVRDEDGKTRYFYDDREVVPCFHPVLSELRPQFILDYDDYLIMDERIHTAVANSGGVHKETTVSFSFETVARDAANQGASDIHIIPKENFYYMFFRKNGDLIEQEKYLLDIDQGWEFVTQIKLDASRSSKGSFKADKHTAPMDARIIYGDIDLRLVFIPDGLNGRRMSVIARVIKKTVISKPDLKAKGFHAPIIDSVIRTSRLDGGFVVISGITGSGKSTFLAEVLASIDKHRRILSIEDPIEYVQSGKNITQHQLYLPPDPKEDRMGYHEFTKAAKRADPNVLSIGEMRNDSQLVDAVFEMAYAGQLVYTTIHIRSCFEVFHALEHVFKMNKESLVPLVFLSVNMKLTKRLCECKKEDTEKVNVTKINEMMPKFRYEHKESAMRFVQNKDGFKTYLHNPKGCPKCGYSGYSGGRVPMYEYFEPSVELIEYILKTKPTNYDIEKYACTRKLGQNRLDTFIQRLIDGEVDTSPAILDAIL